MHRFGHPRAPAPIAVVAVAVALAISCAVGGVKTPTATPAASAVPPPPPTVPAAPPPSEIPSPTAPIVHALFPGNSFTMERYITDTSSQATGSAGRAPGGDYIQQNRFERPFKANTMEYLPFLDIQRAELNLGAPWIYISIQLVGPVTDRGDLQPMYGVEFDTNIDGRGEYLVWGAAPTSTKWSVAGVYAWKDTNGDVGGARPILSDAPAGGNGYDTQIFNQGLGADPDAAWIRIGPTGPTSVQLAVKQVLIGGVPSFMWWVWADAGVQRPEWFDYNDHFTAEDAGSPLVEQKSLYPLKAVAALDNTCHDVYGFSPGGDEPGLCAQPKVPTTGCLYCPLTSNNGCRCVVPCPAQKPFPGTPCNP